MTSELTIEIEKLFEIFAQYPGNPHMQGSPLYGELEKWNSKLFKKPLRDLSADDLSLFAGKAMTTWGEIDDFKHFLPRILELVAKLDEPYDIDIVFGKLEFGNWLTWETREKDGIVEYLNALWKNILKDDSEKAEANLYDYFVAIGNVHPHFPYMLQIWETETSATATLHLANFIYDHAANIFAGAKGGRINNNVTNVEKLRQWLLSGNTIRRLQEAFFTINDESYSDIISWAEKILDNERRNRHPGRNP